MDNSWLDDPIVKKMDPRKKMVLINLLKEVEGKNMNQGFSALMKANNQLSKQGLSFTQEESNLLIKRITVSLSPEEQQKVQMVMQMMNQKKK